MFERTDHIHVGKGYALDYLFGQLDERYGHEAFDAFFIFDADNLLDENYVAEMNQTFCDGYEIVTSCRNSKTMATTGFPRATPCGFCAIRSF